MSLIFKLKLHVQSYTEHVVHINDVPVMNILYISEHIVHFLCDIDFQDLQNMRAMVAKQLL